MSLALSSRLTFSSPAADRIRAAERRAMERMARERAAGAPVAPIPPPSPAPHCEAPPDAPYATQMRIPEWWEAGSALMPVSFPSIALIQREVCEHYRIRMLDYLSDRRTRTIVRPRQIGMYLAKMLTLRSLPEIGRRFGGRDHTTVMYAVRVIDGLVKTDPEIAAAVEHLTGVLTVRTEVAA